MPFQTNKQFNKLFSFCSIALIAAFFTSCGGRIPPNQSTKSSEIIKLTDSPKKNTEEKQPETEDERINEPTITYQAKYGVTYEIIGNVIAKYPHFDLSIFSKSAIPNSKEHIITYELTSKDNFAKTHIVCNPKENEKKHFYIENLHFYYHSNAANHINIYMPPQLLADR